MIDLTQPNILTNNLKTLKETSYDNCNKTFMSFSNYPAVNFDSVKNKYSFKSTNICSKPLRSNDALIILPDNNHFVFIEFKNGVLGDEVLETIRTKIHESLWILNDILDENLDFDTKHVNYILVFNKTKNNRPIKIGKYLAKKAGISFITDGFSRYKFCFHDVKTLSPSEFKTISDSLENGTYQF